MIHRVKATREGRIGKITASGYVIEHHVPFVALPTRKALYRIVRVKNVLNSDQVLAVVLDIGPWNTGDDAYVFGHSRPAAESGIDTQGRHTNKAGIDLGEWVWKQLGMEDNGEVEWEFPSGLIWG